MEWKYTDWLGCWSAKDVNGNEWLVLDNDDTAYQGMHDISFVPSVKDGKKYISFPSCATKEEAIDWVENNYNDYEKYAVLAKSESSKTVSECYTVIENGIKKFYYNNVAYVIQFFADCDMEHLTDKQGIAIDSKKEIYDSPVIFSEYVLSVSGNVRYGYEMIFPADDCYFCYIAICIEKQDADLMYDVIATYERLPLDIKDSPEN